MAGTARLQEGAQFNPFRPDAGSGSTKLTRLIGPGAGGVKLPAVDLNAITAPVLNVFALDDHIIPPDCSRALGAKVGSKDYTEIPLPGGHVGLFVSSKSQGKLSQSIADWLVARDATPVSEA